MKTKSVSLFFKAILFLFVTVTLYADDEKEDSKNPTGCYDEGYRYYLKTVELLPNKDDNSSLYVLHNLSKQQVTLFQMRGDESSRSMYFNHSIPENQWAVFSTTEKKSRFICSVADKRSSYGKIVDCSQYLHVCQYTHVRYGLNNQGNYWLMNSSSKNTIVRSIVYYGMIPGA